MCRCVYFEVWCSLRSNSLKDFWDYSPPWLFSIRGFGNLTLNNSIAFIYANVQVKLSPTPASLHHCSALIKHEGIKVWFKKKGSFAAIRCCMGHRSQSLVLFKECKITLQKPVLSVTEPIAKLSPMAHDGALGDPWKPTSSFRGPMLLWASKLRPWEGGSLKTFSLCFIIFLHLSPYCTLTGFPKNLSHEFSSLPPSLSPFFSAFIFVLI